MEQCALQENVGGGFGHLRLLPPHDPRDRDRIGGVTDEKHLGPERPLLSIEGAALAAMASLSVWNLLMYRSVRLRLGIDPTALGRPPRR